MKNKIITSVLLSLAITSTLTGCANGPVIQPRIEQTIEDNTTEKSDISTENTEELFKTDKDTVKENTEEIDPDFGQLSQDDIATYAYRMLIKLGLIEGSSEDAKSAEITSEDFMNKLVSSGFTYQEFNTDDISKGTVCIGDSSIALCISADNENETYTMYLYDRHKEMSVRTFNKEDLEKYSFKGMFTYGNKTESQKETNDQIRKSINNTNKEGND